VDTAGPGGKKSSDDRRGHDRLNERAFPRGLRSGDVIEALNADEQACPIVQRRLAAIFSADVAGYTRLMNLDEAGTLRLLGSHREIADRLIAQHGGRIANTAGDSILAEFPSASMRCNARSASRSESPR